jgi:hypothetical protein
MAAMPADPRSWPDWLGASADRAAASDSADALRGDGEILHWHTTDEPASDSSGDWLMERRSSGARWQHRGNAADVTINGPARSLLLILTRRLPATDGPTHGVTIEGDVDLVRHWVAHTAHVAG